MDKSSSTSSTAASATISSTACDTSSTLGRTVVEVYDSSVVKCNSAETDEDSVFVAIKQVRDDKEITNAASQATCCDQHSKAGKRRMLDKFLASFYRTETTGPKLSIAQSAYCRSVADLRVQAFSPSCSGQQLVVCDSGCGTSWDKVCPCIAVDIPVTVLGLGGSEVTLLFPKM